MSFDSKFLIEQLRRRLNGQMNDREWAEHQAKLAAAEIEYARRQGCVDCGGTGQWATGGGLSACHCPAGAKVHEAFARAAEKPSIVARPAVAPKKEAPPRRGKDCAFKD